MSRSKSNTVEYFPHVAKQGKTLFILEGKFGNDGYAFWFKLLEILACTENHFYDASQETDWQYLVARARITDESATEMLSLLANLGNIDAELWEKGRIIWCQALVDNLSEVYRKRKRDLPNKPFCDRNKDNCDKNALKYPQSATESTQSKVKESKGKKKEINSQSFFSCPHFSIDEDYHQQLAKDYSGLTAGRLLEEIKKAADWLTDNHKRFKRKSNGHIANPRLFLRNWLSKAMVQGEKTEGGVQEWLRRQNSAAS